MEPHPTAGRPDLPISTLREASPDEPSRPCDQRQPLIGISLIRFEYTAKRSGPGREHASTIRGRFRKSLNIKHFEASWHR